MDYKKGHKIKPYQVQPNGNVLFTDGTTNTLIANQATCEAYGYKYDRTTGTCYSFVYNHGVQVGTEELQNIKKGSENNLQNGTRNTMILGDHNTTEGKNVNCLIIGENHIAELDTQNASIIGGSYGVLSHNSEIVIGGGFPTASGNQQMSIYQLSNKTDGLDITLYCNYDTINEEQIYLPSNSVCIYEVYITGICIGGSEGTAGHFKTKRIMGSLHVENSGAITKTETIDTDTGNSGNTGTINLVVSTANIFSIQITGRPDTAVNWSATVKLYINNTIETF